MRSRATLKMIEKADEKEAPLRGASLDMSKGSELVQNVYIDHQHQVSNELSLTCAATGAFGFMYTPLHQC
jgi:hypothetical protein